MAEAILARWKEYSPVQQRKAAAILGALVADAAATPLHWIYDQEKIRGLVDKVGRKPEFYPTSQSPVYNIETGRNGAYGDQLYVTLKSVAENKGFNPDDLADQLYKHFGPDTEYAVTRQRAEDKKFGKQTDFTSKSLSAVQGPWTNHCVKTFLALREAGVKPPTDGYSMDPDGIVKSIAVVALLSGKPEMLDAVEKCVRVAQSNPIAVGYTLGAARILSHVIQTGSDGLSAALEQLGDQTRSHPFPTDYIVSLDIERGRSARDKPHVQAVREFGSCCELPFSFYCVTQGIAAAAEDYQSAVRNTILGGGDVGSRSSFIGACVAARGGLDSIPMEWILKLKRTEEILGYIETVIKC